VRVQMKPAGSPSWVHAPYLPMNRCSMHAPCPGSASRTQFVGLIWAVLSNEHLASIRKHHGGVMIAAVTTASYR
jgi:hypothetical protein